MLQILLEIKSGIANYYTQLDSLILKLGNTLASQLLKLEGPAEYKDLHQRRKLDVLPF